MKKTNTKKVLIGLGAAGIIFAAGYCLGVYNTIGEVDEYVVPGLKQRWIGGLIASINPNKEEDYEN